MILWMHPMKRNTALMALWAVMAGGAGAQVTVYSSRAAWLAAAAGNVKTIDFTTAAPPPPASLRDYPPPGLTLSGVIFTNVRPAAPVQVISQFYCCPTYARGFDSLASDAGFQITLPPGTSAFGFD